MARASVARIHKKLKEKRVNQVKPRIEEVFEADPAFKTRLFRARFLMIEAEKENQPKALQTKLTHDFESLLKEKGLL